ncbi:hypothetical protein AsFPU1_2421 [Aphanothece sacrum FPU1]|uniref:Uncharacterized protein n=1 Tax=Aphanothece sacrum FPU1 TaxID=1920663 RepID=A0A401II77_APHSA|nr:hypothetical protein AsFPU1_2421 [Aphanothece sacrum FPU1]GBF86159.1 hypothetical protein AsFPU3_3229 [Aphanothece sacrum FPU3]
MIDLNSLRVKLYKQRLPTQPKNLVRAGGLSLYRIRLKSVINYQFSIVNPIEPNKLIKMD